MNPLIASSLTTIEMTLWALWNQTFKIFWKPHWQIKLQLGGEDWGNKQTLSRYLILQYLQSIFTLQWVCLSPKSWWNDNKYFWSERSVCAAHARCKRPWLPIWTVYFLLSFLFFLGYFSNRVEVCLDGGPATKWAGAGCLTTLVFLYRDDLDLVGPMATCHLQLLLFSRKELSYGREIWHRS